MRGQTISLLCYCLEDLEHKPCWHQVISSIPCHPQGCKSGQLPLKWSPELPCGLHIPWSLGQAASPRYTQAGTVGGLGLDSAPHPIRVSRFVTTFVNFLTPSSSILPWSSQACEHNSWSGQCTPSPPAVPSEAGAAAQPRGDEMCFCTPQPLR